MQIYALVLLLALSACSERQVTYHPKDLLSAEIFKFLLERNSLKYVALDDGFYLVESDDRDLIMGLLKSAEAGDERSSFRLQSECQSVEFERLLGEEVPYLKEDVEDDAVLYTLRSSDFDQAGGMGLLSLAQERCSVN